MATRNDTIDIDMTVTIADERVKKGKVCYYAQILEPVGVFEILETKIRTVIQDWFVGIEKHSKTAYLFTEKDIDKRVFFNRDEALEVVKAAQAKCKKHFSSEKYYEEY